MTNVSKKKLNKTISNEIGSRFMLVLSDLNKAKDVNNFFFEFFTASEKIMFQKRLAIIFMISENLPVLTISKSLKVSPSTVNKIYSVVDRGGYKNIIKILEKHKKIFWKELTNIVFASLPKQGKGRWDWLDKHKDLEVLRTKKHYS